MVTEELEKPTQLSLFEDNLPHRPYCTDDKEFGLQLSPKSYELGELAEYLDLPLKLPKRASTEGLDCLDWKEVKGIAKSISRWTWRKYSKQWSDEKFSAIQAKRGRLGGLKGGRGRTPQDEEKRLVARSMRSEGHTLKAVSLAMGVPLSTVGRWCKIQKIDQGTETAAHNHNLRASLTKEEKNVNLTPVVNGKLTAKQFFTPAKATAWQDSYAAKTNLARGISSEVQHQAKKDFELKKAAKRGYEKGKKFGYKKGYEKGLNDAQKIGAKVGNVVSGLMGQLHKPNSALTAQLTDEKRLKDEEVKKAKELAKQAKIDADNR
ncbi:hypothetical protein ANCDUO_19000, partial [Ancylostoma duodenale]